MNPADEGMELVELSRHNPTPEEWYSRLDRARDLSIIAAIGGLAKPLDPQGGPVEAFREAARAMVEQKLTERMLKQMKRVEYVGIALAIVGLLVAIPSAILAAIQLWGKG